MKKTFIILFFSLFFVSCSTTPFSSYSNELGNLRTKYNSGNSFDVIDKLESRENSRDGILYCLENGRIYQSIGDYSNSREKYEKAYNILLQKDNEALYRVRDGVKNSGSLLINDNVMDYEIANYERVLLGSYQALNYLLLGDLSGAGVEMRRALQVQREQEKNYEEQIVLAREQIGKSDDIKIRSDITNKVNLSYQNMLLREGSVRSCFENAFTYYLAAIVQQLNKDFSNADVSYRKALAVMPNNRTLQNEYNNYKNRLSSKEVGTVFCIVDFGLVPLREEKIVPLPTGAGIVTISFPYYNNHAVANSNFFVENLSNGNKYQTGKICDIGDLAKFELKERMNMIIARLVARTALRVATQYAIKNQTEQDSNSLLVGTLLTSIWNVASERADTRSWSMLPQTVSVGSFNLAIGKHKLKVADEYIDVNITASKSSVLIYVNKTNLKTVVSVINL